MRIDLVPDFESSIGSRISYDLHLLLVYICIYISRYFSRQVIGTSATFGLQHSSG